MLNPWLCINQRRQHVKGYVGEPCSGCPSDTIIACFAGCCTGLWFCLFMLPVVVVVVVVVMVVVVVVMLLLLLLLVAVAVVVY